ncbi:MBOAT family O-acyltransferase [Echinimonas agarilytica]|uniref:Probable alginate O-acetylase n=1 Tax=Echinimonas agarilytica TaxID=1215918 RepID=A0AA42B905_9GAMM|nr:MBOAT family protein [Echinimonas agarilytica]MCM2681490.1 MBOAT family protein [Echinimonas agarilytica]
MLFNSYEFIFFFLPMCLSLYFIIGRYSARAAICMLVVASLGFYGWWKASYLVLIVGSMVGNFCIGRFIEQALKRSGSSAKLVLTVGVTLNLALLGYYKYFNFFVDQINLLTGSNIYIAKIALPLAISFFTFQQIAYLVDTYRKEIEEHSFLQYCLFVTFFPQLIAGPIVHHKEMLPQFAKAETFRFNCFHVSAGLTLFSIGLFKKVVLADGVAVYASPVFGAADAGQTLTMFEAWTGTLAYTLQLYFDFSGYSDMALGLARLFGIRLPENFNSPYKATSIVDFWRRWHMTLSRFLRDYLYIALGGNRKGPKRRYVNLMLTMVLGGLWHGAGWNFIIWGFLHGTYLGVNHAWSGLRKRVTEHPIGKFETSCYWLVTIVAVMVSWVFFRAETTEGAVSMLASMTDVSSMLQLDTKLVSANWAMLWCASLILIAVFVPNSMQITRYLEGKLAASNESGQLQWPLPAMSVISGAAALFAISQIGQFSEFLYFNF